MTLNNTGSGRLPTPTDATTVIAAAERPPTLPVAVTLIDDELVKSFSHTKRVGNYLLGRTIGEGSFAKVKEALHVITGELVAVKIIDKKKAKEDPYVKRNMRRESKLLQQIRHRNIVQLFEVMETENSYYLVMEYCGGGDLLERIYSRKRLDEIETRRYIRQIVSAVEYMHKAGVIHRDLKVENLLLDEERDIKIIVETLRPQQLAAALLTLVSSAEARQLEAFCLDLAHVLGADSATSTSNLRVTKSFISNFGLSNSIRVDNKSSVSRSINNNNVIHAGDGPGTDGGGGGGGGGGGVAPELCTTQCGSPAYAAPELLNNNKYGPKVDIWSIGVNMFAMLTGNLPFTVEPFTIRALHNKMIKGEMNAIPDHLSKGCRDLLQRFLTPDPERRISLQQAMHHPWLAGKKSKQLEPAPFPNRLRPLDLSQSILVYMAQRLDFRLADVINQVTSNSPSGATAVYFLLQRRLGRYQRQRSISRSPSTENIHNSTFQREPWRRRSSADKQSSMATVINVPSTVDELYTPPTTTPRTATSTVMDHINDDLLRSTITKQPRVSLSTVSQLHNTIFVSFDNNNGGSDTIAPKIVLDDVTDALDDVIHVDGNQRCLDEGGFIRKIENDGDDIGSNREDDVTMAVTYRCHGDSFDLDEKRHGCDRQDCRIDERSRGGNLRVEDRKEMETHTGTDDESRFDHDIIDPPLYLSNGGASCRRPSKSDVKIDIDIECDDVSDNRNRNIHANSPGVDDVPRAAYTTDKRSPMNTANPTNPGGVSTMSASVTRRNVYRAFPRRRHGNSTAAAAAAVTAAIGTRGSGTPGRNKSVAVHQPLPADRGRNHQSTESKRTQLHAHALKIKAVDLPTLTPLRTAADDDDELPDNQELSGSIAGGWRLNGGVTTTLTLPHPGQAVSGRSTSFRQRTWLQAPRRQHTTYQLITPRQPVFLFSGNNEPAYVPHRSTFVADAANHDCFKSPHQAESLKSELPGNAEAYNIVDLKFTGDKAGSNRGHQVIGSPTLKRQLTVTNVEPPIIGGFSLLPPLSTRRSLEHYDPRS